MFAALALTVVLSADPRPIDEGRRLFHAMRYPQAVASLKAAVTKTSLSAVERREGYDLLARSLLAEGRAQEAESAYSELLAGDPNAPDPADAAPKILKAFTSAKERLYPERYVRFVLRGAPTVGVPFEVELVDPWRTTNSVTVVELDDGGLQATRTISPALTNFTLLPGPRAVQLRMAARDGSGELLATAGTDEAPLRVRGAPALALKQEQPQVVVAAEPAPEVEKAQDSPRALPWVLGAAAVVAAGAGSAFAVRSLNDSRAAGDAGSAQQTRTLDASARSNAITANVLVGGALLLGGAAVLVAFDLP